MYVIVTMFTDGSSRSRVLFTSEADAVCQYRTEVEVVAREANRMAIGTLGIWEGKLPASVSIHGVENTPRHEFSVGVVG